MQIVVEWFHNGANLQLGSRIRPSFEFGHVRLDVLSAIAEDSGTYVAVVTNQIGSVQTEASLSVTGMPIAL